MFKDGDDVIIRSFLFVNKGNYNFQLTNESVINLKEYLYLCYGF
jgi:hypothetical protein